MQYLVRLDSNPQASWYRLEGDYGEGGLGRWVVSTPTTRDICNRPEILGVDFSRRLQDGVRHALATAPFHDALKALPETRLCIMNFLRGSLNFGLRGALRDALGSNRHGTCFMSSQRFRKDGRWHVKEDMYRKMDIPQGALLLLGDVVATGVTVSNGLEVITDHLVRHELAPVGVVFFTLGCHKAEKALQTFHDRFSKARSDYLGTHVVYLEGKFTLVDSRRRLHLAIPGTDLIKADALLSPEFELSLYDAISHVLERCVIYDAGSRAFDVPEYLEDVLHYWEQIRRLAKRGYTLREAMQERWPEEDHRSLQGLRELRAQRWRGVPQETV
ncbi:MAG: hypothetical protein FJ098_11550, partial [Deltaproteobacteria bacterium]|nr:hypothetical protein [Deltaproteobacteria bacterium]